MFGLDMVSWKDYQGVEGFGQSSQQDVDELNKALLANADINNPGSSAGEGFPLRVESLESTLKSTTYRMEHLKLFKALPKIPAFNTVEEHNEISSYGQNPDAGFIEEGSLPAEDDSVYARKYAVVKFLGTSRRVSHVMSLVKPAHGSIIANETVSGTMHLLKILERALFYGNSDLCALQFDGFEKLITANSPATNIIDMRGEPLSEDSLTDACLTVFDAPNYGFPTHLHCNPKCKADLVKTFFPKERHNTFAGNGNTVGLDVKAFTSPAGDVQFESNVFVTDGGAPTAAVGSATLRPASPVISTSATDTANVLSQYGADDAGSYFFKIQACNRFGRSAAVNVDGSAISVDAGDMVTFGVTPSGAVEVEWYEIYKTKKAGAITTTRLVLKVANAAGAGEQVIIELNANIPYTTSAFLFQQNLECMSFKQLAPMVKIPLATIDSSIRWMQLLYGTPVLYTPGKVALIKNIGRPAGYVGAP
jgi:hypothetical protein